MSSIATKEFLNFFKKYATNHMFDSALNDVGKQFLDSTERKSITGIRYTTLCLILAQAMENMLAGYGGRSSVDIRYLSEAIGYQLGNPSVDPMGVARYHALVTTVHELQQTVQGFADSIENFLNSFSHQSEDSLSTDRLIDQHNAYSSANQV